MVLIADPSQLLQRFNRDLDLSALLALRDWVSGGGELPEGARLDPDSVAVAESLGGAEQEAVETLSWLMAREEVAS